MISVVYKLGPKRTCELLAGAFLFMEKSQPWAVLKTQAVQALGSDCRPPGFYSLALALPECISATREESRGPLSLGEKLEKGERLGSWLVPCKDEMFQQTKVQVCGLPTGKHSLIPGGS